MALLLLAVPGPAARSGEPETIALLGSRLAADRLVFEFQTRPGSDYLVEQRDELARGAWQWCQPIAGSGAPVTVSVATPSRASQFYRVRTLEIFTGVTLTPEDHQRLSAAHRPAHTFDAVVPPPSPDYASADSWAAHWPGEDAADLSPPNTLYPEAQATAAVDVFFIHPTCYGKPEFWNGPIDDPDVQNSVAGILMYLASVFNAAGRVYAPRYRQFNVSALLERESISGLQAIELAYRDVEQAFAHFVQHFNQGRPFILAGHSQGSIHGSRLLQEQIVGTPLQQKLVAAYLIGMTIPADLPGIHPSRSTTDLGTIVNWTSYAPGGDPTFMREDVVIWVAGSYRKARGIASIQINPLSWEFHGAKVPAADNPGSLPADPSSELPPLIPGVTSADASGAVLVVDTPSVAGFPGDGPDMPLLNADRGDFHNYDY